MLLHGPSQHLSWLELACHSDPPVSYPRIWIDRALLLASEFEAIREECGRLAGHAVSITVLSAFRTPEHNAAIGGASISQHLDGRALDLVPPAAFSLDDFAMVVLDQASRRGIIRGVGVYHRRGSVHIDTRPQIQLARWGD